ncbi:hypothetical protein HA402_014029 [Bradysia odoriphaga]|nr:hypothetical protein HA402_014029 [Bradysia odoriphaga]
MIDNKESEPEKVESIQDGVHGRARSEATFQSIDESMIKFKGRSTMKQFMKDKPVKRGIKDGLERMQKPDTFMISTFIKEKRLKPWREHWEKDTIRDPNVAIIVDRFFMSVHLQRTIPFACVGTVMTNRKNLPQITVKLQRGESKAVCSEDGIIYYKWQDTKEVSLLINCHSHIIETADRKQKDGSYISFDCPQAFVFYNQFMAGVDKADQYSTTYEVDRKSNKWWKRVYHRLLQITVSNAWILFKQLKKSEEMPLIDFLVPLAEGLIEIGRSVAKIQRNMSSGRPSKRSKLVVNIGHQPVEGGTMRSLSSSEWVSAIKLNCNYAALNGVPGVGSTSLLCRKCNRESETIAHVTGSCSHNNLLITSRHHCIKHILIELLKAKGFTCFEEVHALDTEGQSRFSDIVAFHPKLPNAYIIDPTIRYETSNPQQDDETQKEKEEIYKKCIPFYEEKYANTFGIRKWSVRGLWFGSRGSFGASFDENIVLVETTSVNGVQGSFATSETDDMDEIMSQIDTEAVQQNEQSMDEMDLIISQIDTEELQLDDGMSDSHEIIDEYTAVLSEISEDVVNEMEQEDDDDIEHEIPPELMEEYHRAMDQIVPTKSGNRYLQAYDVFRKWQEVHRTNSFDEKILLAYFGSAAKKYKPPTLWSMYSMLKKTLLCKHNVDLVKHCRLRAFLKMRSDGYQPKKANVFETEHLRKFFLEAPNDVYLQKKIVRLAIYGLALYDFSFQVVMIFGLCSGSRGCELTSLTLDNVKDDGKEVIVRLPETKMKTKVTKLYVVGNEFAKIIRQYLDMRPSSV